MDVEVNERRVPSNQKSKLIHESKGYVPLETWKLGLKKTEWTRPYPQLKKLEQIIQVNLLWECLQDLTRYPTSAPSQ